MSDYTMKLLEIDLGTRASRVIDVTEEGRRFLGGNGLGSKLVWDLVPPGTDPLSSQNILHIGVGPITGLVGCKTSCSFLSPLTGWAGEATISGCLGDEIIRTNYNAGILVRGKASKPSYLLVHDDLVEVRDASDLWGSYLLKTENTLRSRLYQETGKEFAALCIGPGGENLVKFANATSESVHSASAGGIGAVFGSKNLKAIAVKGTKAPIYASHEKVWELKKESAMHPATMSQKTTGWGRYGANDGMRALLNYGGDSFKNGHLSWDPIANRSDAFAHELSYRVWTHGCPGCASPCFQPFFKNTSHGAFGGELRHGNTAALCGNAMMGFDEVEEINSLLEELGVDAENIQGLMAWAMDLYEHGIITKGDLDGIELKWGDKEATMALMKKIVYREGKAPAALADGWWHAMSVFGPESRRLAWCSTSNQSVARYEPRSKGHGMGLMSGTGPGGGGGLNDAATMCIFAAFPFYSIWGPPNEVARTFLNAATGWELTARQIDDTSRRISYLARCLSLREGFRPEKHAGLPQRAFEEPVTSKYGVRSVWTTGEWDEAKKKHYARMGLSERGLPRKSDLDALGLGFVVPTLAPLGVID